MTDANGKRNGDGDASAGPLFDNLSLPSLDFGSAIASQQKNMAALAQLNELALTGAQEVQRRQVEFVKETVDGFATMVLDLVKPNALSAEWVEKQAESSKQAIAKSLEKAREMADLLAKTNAEAFGILSQRMSEGLGEVGVRK